MAVETRLFLPYDIGSYLIFDKDERMKLTESLRKASEDSEADGKGMKQHQKFHSNTVWAPGF